MTLIRTADHHPIDRPDWYVGGDGLQLVEVEEAWGLGNHLAQALQYIVRAGRKDDLAQDLGKAAWWLRRAMEIHEEYGPLPLFCAPTAIELSPYRIDEAFGLDEHAIGAKNAIYLARWDARFHLRQALEWVERWAIVAARSNEAAP